MQASQKARALIEHFEGCKLRAYVDPATGGDPITIGVGHVQAGMTLGTVWTQAQCDAALDHDLLKFATVLNGMIGGAPTTQPQYDAMIGLIFNIGPTKFAGSSVLRFHLAGKHDAAANSFALWNKGNGRVMAGLVARRSAEAELYRS